jgi:hypothetical protein
MRQGAMNDRSKTGKTRPRVADGPPHHDPVGLTGSSMDLAYPMGATRRNHWFPCASRCDSMSPSVLSQRLVELQEADIIRQSERGMYTLTPEGLHLLQALAPLNEWALLWAERERSHQD